MQTEAAWSSSRPGQTVLVEHPERSPASNEGPATSGTCGVYRQMGVLQPSPLPRRVQMSIS
jgi:hypothetical protein